MSRHSAKKNSKIEENEKKKENVEEVNHLGFEEPKWVNYDNLMEMPRKFLIPGICKHQYLRTH